MKPVLTPQEMAEVDRLAPEPEVELINRAAHRVASEAIQMLGGGYGRRVHVIAGPGNNGEDGRVAAEKLQQRGVKVSVSTPNELVPTQTLRSVHLIIDAAFGTGFRGEYQAPLDWDNRWVQTTFQPSFYSDRQAFVSRDIAAQDIVFRRSTHAASAPAVLAVDIPSGVNGLNGHASQGVIQADRTITFAAVKPGVLYNMGTQLSGDISIADIGLDVGPDRNSRDPDLPLTWWMEPADLRDLLVPRPWDTHKWRAAVWVIGGSPGMQGAPSLTADAAARSGAGYVRVSTPGVAAEHVAPFGSAELVRTCLLKTNWSKNVLTDAHRFHSLVIGPGLGRDLSVPQELETILSSVEQPVIIDGDGLGVWDGKATVFTRLCQQRFEKGWITVITPHDGEFQAITGSTVGHDRLAHARHLAKASGAIVVLKGPTTTIADPMGTAYISTAGDSRLATAGTGDVLAGMIAAQLAVTCHTPAERVAQAVELHGVAAGTCAPFGFVASDIVKALPQLVDAIL